jgi:hypothetical protein
MVMMIGMTMMMTTTVINMMIMMPIRTRSAAKDRFTKYNYRYAKKTQNYLIWSWKNAYLYKEKDCERRRETSQNVGPVTWIFPLQHG